jgi:hypothetical protein
MRVLMMILTAAVLTVTLPQSFAGDAFAGPVPKDCCR